MGLETFIGSTLTFPIELDARGSAIISSDRAVIKESLKTIISWPLGTRFFLKEFGSRLHEILDEPNDLILRSLVQHFVIDIITVWEKRVEQLDIQFIDSSDDKLTTLLTYNILNTQTEDSFVFPFYKNIIT